MSSITDLIKQPMSNVFRRLYVKRRLLSDGLFETDWQEITDDVKKWGKIKSTSDLERKGFFRFSSFRFSVANDTGKYSKETFDSSFWNGYASRHRTLVKVEAGFEQYTVSGGVYTRTELPSDPSQFIGVVSGDIVTGDNNTMNFDAKPLFKIFQDYPARNLVGWTSTGMTAEQFCQMVRDQTDGAGQYVFRPFFGDTTTNWNIATTTQVYGFLNTGTSKDIIDTNVWDVIEKLAVSENKIPYIGKDGTFNFASRPSTASSTFQFYGAGVYDRTYGNTVVKINNYTEEKVSSFYPRVSLKWVNEDTATAYHVVESTLAVSGANLPWNLGWRTLEIQNFWIQDSATAEALAEAIFADVSSIKKEIDFTATFVPHLNFLDTIDVSYDTSGVQQDSNWDENVWDDELTWDGSEGDAILLKNEEFNLLNVELDIEKFQTKIKARET